MSAVKRDAFTPSYRACECTRELDRDVPTSVDPYRISVCRIAITYYSSPDRIAERERSVAEHDMRATLATV